MSWLSTEQVGAYWLEGYLVIRNVLAQDIIESLLEESRRLWDSVDIVESNPRVQCRKRIDGSRVANRIDPILDISPFIQSLAEEERLIGAASQLVHGNSDVRVFKAKLISKWPQTLGYEMHQDYAYWADFTTASADCFVTALVVLDRFDELSGAIEFFPGLHHTRIAPPANNPRDVDETRIDLTTGELVELEPGDVVFFHGLAPHRSGANCSGQNRQSLFVTYVVPEHSNIVEHYYSGRPCNFMEGD